MSPFITIISLIEVGVRIVVSTQGSITFTVNEISFWLNVTPLYDTAFESTTLNVPASALSFETIFSLAS